MTDFMGIFWANFAGKGHCPVVFGCCLLVVVTKLHNEFASLRQVNRPNSQDKFQICCTDMHF